MAFPPCPDSLKPIAHYLKVADEHNGRDIVVTYWCRLHAVQIAMKMHPGNKPPEVTNLLIALMTWLENTKKEYADNEGIHNESCAQAMIENYALKLFKFGDQQDLAEVYNKNVIKAFYTSGLLMDVLQCFGDLSDDIIDKRKYAKWKAAYIHNCLKVGDRPVPGPPGEAKELFIPKDVYYSDPANIPPPEDNVEVPSSTPNSSNTSWSKPTIPNATDSPTFPMPIPGPSPVAPGPPPPTNYQWPQFPLPELTPNVVASTPSNPAVNPPPSNSQSLNLDAEQVAKAQKYCKWAASALTYDDVNTAVTNLQKALNLLQLGKDD